MSERKLNQSIWAGLFLGLVIGVGIHVATAGGNPDDPEHDVGSHTTIGVALTQGHVKTIETRWEDDKIVLDYGGSWLTADPCEVPGVEDTRFADACDQELRDLAARVQELERRMNAHQHDSWMPPAGGFMQPLSVPSPLPACDWCDGDEVLQMGEDGEAEWKDLPPPVGLPHTHGGRA